MLPLRASTPGKYINWVESQALFLRFFSSFVLLSQISNNQVETQPLLVLRKEVIQPHLPIRLPCYDFTPVIAPTLDGYILAVYPPASGVNDFRGVTGGVYKARERIHRSMLTCDY